MDWTNEMLVIALFVVYNSFMVTAEVLLTPNFDRENYRILDYRAVNILQCNITGEIPQKAVMKWFKNNELLESKDGRIEVKDNQLIIRRTNDDDIANYSCALVDKDDNDRTFSSSEIIETLGKPLAKIQVVNSTNPVVEGGRIKLECIVTGKPKPVLEWRKETSIVSSKRIKVSDNFGKNIAKGYLEIEDVQMSDRGEYYCSGHNRATDFVNGTEAVIFIRVKDKLAALWPFIGICAEVLVLCLVIYIYERKRNKSELDESDTDQSPEQKNTPDHGKESVRQRK